jgi:hypothetical protein
MGGVLGYKLTVKSLNLKGLCSIENELSLLKK